MASTSTEEKKITTEYFTDITPCSVKSHKQAGPFFLGRLLGKGATGSVRLGTHVENGFQVAIKIVKKKYLEDPQNWRLFRREVAIMKMIDHPNIVKLYDVLESDKEIFLVTELVTGGELFDYIPRGGLPHDECLRILSQIIRALSHCHKYGIVHRDLKPENIILDETKNVKLGDFGMARLMKKGVLLKTSCGSPHYASPEVLKGGEYDGKVSDVWSLGVMLYAMCTFSLPFDSEHIRTLFKKIQRGVYRAPSNVKPEMADLISQMLTVDPTKRIKMDDIQYHAVYSKTDHFTQPLARSAPSCSSLCFSHLRPHSGDTLDENVFELDEAALEDLNQLSLGWKSKDELAKAILQEGSKEKFMYNLMMCTKHRRIEELSKKSPTSSRRGSLSESEKPYPSSPFDSPPSKTRSLTTGSPSSRTYIVTAESPSKSSRLTTQSPPSRRKLSLDSPAQKTRSLSLDSPATKVRTLSLDSPATKTRTLSPVAKVRSLSTGSPSPRGSVLERKISLDPKPDNKETDSPRVAEPEVELTEELLLQVANARVEEKFQHIEVKDSGQPGRRGSVDSIESDSIETESAAASQDVSDEDDTVGTESPLYDSPPSTVGVQEREKEDGCETLTEELEHQRQIYKQVKDQPTSITATATATVTLAISATSPPPSPAFPALSPTPSTSSTSSLTPPTTPLTTSPSTASPSTTTPTITVPTTTTATDTLAPPKASDLSFSKSFLKSRRLFPTYRYEPTKDEASHQQETLNKTHPSHEKRFSANVNAIWSFLSSAWKRRKERKKKSMTTK